MSETSSELKIGRPTSKRMYRVTVRPLDPPAAIQLVRTFPASNPHYAVREGLFAMRHDLPRGWKRLAIEVSR